MPYPGICCIALAEYYGRLSAEFPREQDEIEIDLMRMLDRAFSGYSPSRTAADELGLLPTGNHWRTNIWPGGLVRMPARCSYRRTLATYHGGNS